MVSRTAITTAIGLFAGACTINPAQGNTQANPTVAAAIVADAQAVISSSDKGVLTYEGSTTIGCGGPILFLLGSVTLSPSVSNDGRIAAFRTCDDVMLVDLASGVILQKAPVQDFYPVSVHASESDVIVLGFRRQTSFAEAGFLEMSAASGIRPSDVRLPKELDGDVALSGVTESIDGVVIAADVCPAPENGCPLQVVWDFPLRQMILQLREPEGLNRMVSSIQKESGRYFLISSIRTATPDTWYGEVTDLSTQEAKHIPYDSITSQRYDIGRPVCHQTIVSTNHVQTSMVWPNGKSIALEDPVGRPIQTCTVSANGKHLLVSVSPFVHRYLITTNR